MSLLNAGMWDRVTKGVYDAFPQWKHERARDWEHQRRRPILAALLAHGPSAVAVGVSALVLHGAAGLPRGIGAEISMSDGTYRAARTGLRVRQFRDAMEVRRWWQWHIAEVPWAIAQGLPQLPSRHAVAVLDSLIHQRKVSHDGLAQARELMWRKRGTARIHRLWALVDGNAESPLETFARLDCIAGGCAPDETQVEIRTANGTFLARGDLGWRIGNGRWLIAEIDGAEFHDLPRAVFRDRERQNALVTNGHLMLRFSARDVAVRGRVKHQVATALRQVSRLSTSHMPR